MLRDVHPYIDRVPDYEVRDGVMRIDFGEWCIYMPMRVFRLAQARGGKAVRDHDAAGKVVPFRGG